MGTSAATAARSYYRTKEELIEEAERIGREIIERARAARTSPHGRLALDQLAAELHCAGHLEADAKRLAREGSGERRAAR
jgi:hypothetical protein